MKINFITPHLRISGGPRIIFNYAHFLNKRGHKVRVIVVNKVKWRRFLANLINFKPKWIRNLSLDILRIPNLEEKYLPKADITVTSSWVATRDVEFFSNRIGEKFSLVQHNEGMYHGDAKEVNKTYLSKKFKKIVVSSWLKGIMEDKFGSHADLLLNPINRNQFYPVKKKKSDYIRIFILNHNYKWKGTKEALEIINSVKKDYPKIKIIAFGVRNSNLEDGFDKYYKDPPQNKFADIYSEVDIYLCTSWWEGSGLMPLEAMACKTAVVTYDNGGSRDFAFDGKTAFVAKNQDIKDLEDKLRLAVSNKELRDKIAENGYEHFLSMPTWEEQAKRMEEIFTKSIKDNA